MKKLLFTILFSLFGVLTHAENRLYVETVEIKAGEEKRIDFLLENDESLYAFQTKIVFPEGLEIVTKEGVPQCALASRTDESFTLSSNLLSAREIQLATYSLTPISGTSGVLFSITVKAAESFSGGDMKIENTIFTDENAQDVNFSDVTTQVKLKTSLAGDLNGDGLVNIQDIVATVDLVAKGTYTAAADVNGDGVVNIQDVVAIVNLGLK